MNSIAKFNIWQSVEKMDKFNLAFNLCAHYKDVLTEEEFVRMFLHLRYNHPINMLRSNMFAVYMQRYHAHSTFN